MGVSLFVYFWTSISLAVYIFNLAHRVRPEQGYKKPEPEPDYENTVPVPAPVNQIFKNKIRFQFYQNRIFKYYIRFRLGWNQNRNFGRIYNNRNSSRFLILLLIIYTIYKTFSFEII